MKKWIFESKAAHKSEWKWLLEPKHWILWTFFFACSLQSTLKATEEYARMEKKQCIYCHFSHRGGPKNFLGHYYARNGYSFKNTVFGSPEYQKSAPLPPDLSFQRPTAQDRIEEKQLEILKSIHYRAVASGNYYAGAQLVQSGKDFAHKLDVSGIAYNKNLEEMLVREIFGIGRYNIESLALNSAMGLSMNHAPLVHLKSREQKLDTLKYLESRVNLMKKTAGYDGDEFFSPVYAEFASGDPHYTQKPDFLTGKAQSWDDAKMNKTIEMEAIGMGLYAKSVLAANYLKNVHAKGVGVTPKAGYTAQVLIYEMVNTMLWIRYGLGFDGAKFRAFPPDYYESKQLLYLPNKLVVEFDKQTNAPTSYFVKERLSHLGDLASLILGVSEFYGMSDPHNLALKQVFGNGVDDSKEFPFSYNSRYLAKEILQFALKNIELMHFDKMTGAAYSTATFVKPIKVVRTRDMALTLHALGKAFKYFYDDSEIRNVTGNLLYAMSQFMIQNLQAIDGGMATNFDSKRIQGDFLSRTLEDQSMSLVGLLEAFKVSREERFYRSATRIYEFIVNRLWSEKMNTFKTTEDSDVLKITPQNFGSTIAALREMTLATGDLRTFAYLLAYFEGIMKNYSLQLSELDFTGEKIDDEKDSDGDGILQSDMGDGKFGIAPVLASEISVEPVKN